MTDKTTEYYPIGTRVEFTKDRDCMVPLGTNGTVVELDKSGHSLSHRILWDIYVGVSNEINTDDSNVRSTWESRKHLRSLSERSYKQGDKVVTKIGLAGFPSGTGAMILSVDYNSTNRLKYYVDFGKGNTMWLGDLEIEPDKAWNPTLYNSMTFEVVRGPEIASGPRVSFVSDEDSGDNLFTERVRLTVKESEIEKLARVENFSF